MLVTTTTSGHIGHWIKMRRSLARFSALESSVRTRYSADFIITTPGFRFSVHTGRYSLRDLAGFADIERLLSDDVGGERFSDDAPADDATTSAAPRPQPGGDLRRRRHDRRYLRGIADRARKA